MTQEFINEHCIGCEYCIYTNSNPWGCGEIDQYGCRSTDLKSLKQCRYGYKPIAHTPRFKAGDRIVASPNPIRILSVVTGINGYYITQMEGLFGRFNNNQYPKINIDLEEIDYNYELVADDEEEPNQCTQCPFTNTDCVYCKTCRYSVV